MSAGANRRAKKSFGQEDYGTYPEQKCSGFLYVQGHIRKLAALLYIPGASGREDSSSLSGCVNSVKVP